MAKQEIRIAVADPIAYVKQILEYGGKGAVLKDNTFPRLKTFPLTAILEIETNTGLEDNAGVTHIPVPLSERVYTKEELENMSWEDFKANVYSKEIKGRDRDVMTRKYLEATGQEVK